MKNALFLCFVATFPFCASAAPGDLDPLDANIAPGAVNATAVQPDGKMIVGGERLFRRVNANGSLDASLAGEAGKGVQNVTILVDGKILVAGYDYQIAADTSFYHIARHLPDGSPDDTFHCEPRPDKPVNCMVVQTDGKILLGGEFTSIGGMLCNRIARLNADGSVDAAFKTGTGVDGRVYSVAVQADGKVLLGGEFTKVNGVPCKNIARLQADGGVESTAMFNPGTGADSSVYCIIVQADGKILIGGSFTQVNGSKRLRIARLNANGTLDSSFFPYAGKVGGAAARDKVANNGVAVLSMALQVDGKVLVGGSFGGSIHRLSAQGAQDSRFKPNEANIVPNVGRNRLDSIALQGDGKVLVGGRFTKSSAVAPLPGPERNMVRLQNDPASERLTVQGANRVEWMRSGASPEVSDVTFELSTDGGSKWTALGPGKRIAGGWECNGLHLPQSGHVRVRGRTTSGEYNGSSGLVGTTTRFPVQ